MTTIQSVHIAIDGEVPGLRPADSVPVTIHLPEGDVEVAAWCNETRFEMQFRDEPRHFTRIAYFEVRPRQPGETEDDLF